MFSEKFNIVALVANNNIKLLEEQTKEFDVKNVVIVNQEKAEIFKKNNPKINVLSSEEGLLKVLDLEKLDLIVMAISSAIASSVVIKALNNKINVAIATKEVLVEEGESIMKLARKNNVHILPIDSEHSAMWQALRYGEKKEINKIILTCSGGPFLDKKWTKEKLQFVTKKQALKHPNWSMGTKISIDSATLMNKALELIETYVLFELDYKKIQVVIHPQSILHSAVEFCDGSIIGQMGTPDMRTAICYALFFPERKILPFPKLNLFEQNLTFEKVDNDRFPSIFFAEEAIKNNKTKILNQSNEKSVQKFLTNEIRFMDIFLNIKKDLGIS